MTNTTHAETAQASAALDERALRQAFGKFTTGVTIVTADVNGKRVGMTANSFSSLSLNPPLVLWSVRKSSTNYEDFMAAPHFAVNILSTGQTELSQRFAKSSETKFEGITHGVGIGGSPTFEEATAIFECRTEALHDAGDHVIMVGRVEKVALTDHRPLAFSEGRYSATIEHPTSRPPRQSGPNGQGKDPLHRYVSVLLLRAYSRMSDEMAEIREAEDISANQSRILAIACTYPGSTLARLMPRTYMTELAAEDTVQELVSRGFLTVHGDGVLEVTPAGRKKSDRLMDMMAALEEKFLKDVSPVKVELLKEVLEDIIEADISASA